MVGILAKSGNHQANVFETTFLKIRDGLCFKVYHIHSFCMFLLSFAYIFHGILK